MPNTGLVVPKCPICLDHDSAKGAIVVTRCGHLFHDQCIREWDEKQKHLGRRGGATCPSCKDRLNKPHPSRFTTLHALTETAIPSSSSPVKEGVSLTDLGRRMFRGRPKEAQVLVEGSSDDERDGQDSDDEEDIMDVDDPAPAGADGRTLREALTTALSTNDELKASLEAKEMLLADLNATFEEERGRMRTEINKAKAGEKRLARAKEQAETALEEEKSQWEREKATWTKDKGVLRDRVRVLEQELAELKRTIGMHEDRVSQAETIAAEEASRAQALQATVDRLEGESASLSKKLDLLRRGNSSYAEKLAKQKQENAELRRTAEQARRDLADMEAATASSVRDPLSSHHWSRPGVAKGKQRATDDSQAIVLLDDDDENEEESLAQTAAQSFQFSPIRFSMTDEVTFIPPGLLPASPPRRSALSAKENGGRGTEGKGKGKERSSSSRDPVLEGFKQGKSLVALGPKTKIRVAGKVRL